MTAERDQKIKELEGDNGDGLLSSQLTLQSVTDSNTELDMLKKVSRAKTLETEQYRLTSVLQGKECKLCDIKLLF